MMDAMIISTKFLMTARRYPGYYATPETERNRDSHQSLFVKIICNVKASVSKHFSTCWGQRPMIKLTLAHQNIEKGGSREVVRR